MYRLTLGLDCLYEMVGTALCFYSLFPTTTPWVPEVFFSRVQLGAWPTDLRPKAEVTSGKAAIKNL